MFAPFQRTYRIIDTFSHGQIYPCSIRDFFLHHDHDISAAIETLGWQPRSYAEGITQVAADDWWK